jgi:tetratricopeptide (TPR) repeat protein
MKLSRWSKTRTKALSVPVTLCMALAIFTVLAGVAENRSAGQIGSNATPISTAKGCGISKSVQESLAKIYQYRNNGMPMQAVPLAEKIPTISASQVGPDSLQTADILERLADAMWISDRHNEAVNLYTAELRIRSAIQGRLSKSLLVPLTWLIDIDKGYGQYDPLPKLMAWKEEILERYSPGGSLNIAENLEDIAFHYSDANQSKAEPLFKRAFQIRSRLQGIHHRDTLNTLRGLAWCYDRCGNPKSAEAEYRRMLALSSNPQDRANSLCELASHYEHYTHNPKSAAETYLQVVAIDKQLGHIESQSNTLRDLAYEYFRLQDWTKQGDVLAQRVALWRDCNKMQTADGIDCLKDLFSFYVDRKRCTEAEKTGKELLSLVERTKLESGRWFAGSKEEAKCQIWTGLSRAYKYQGDYVNLEESYRSLLQLRQKQYPGQSWRLMDLSMELADAYEHNGKLEEATAIYKLYAGDLSDRSPLDTPRYDALQHYLKVLNKMGDKATAQRVEDRIQNGAIID